MNTDRIKFRVWSEKLNRYYYNYSINIDGDLFPCMIYHKKDVDGNITIEQCTGLKDKNGKLIYEGDIIRTTDYSGDSEVGRVEWKESQYVFVRKVGYFSFQVLLDWGTVLEVIGNIHEPGGK